MALIPGTLNTGLTKEQIMVALSNALDSYIKSEIDTMLADKASQTDLTDLQTSQSEQDGKISALEAEVENLREQISALTTRITETEEKI